MSDATPAGPPEEPPEQASADRASADRASADRACPDPAQVYPAQVYPAQGDEAQADPYRAAGPAPLGLVRTPTGRPAVDALLDRLAAADDLTSDGHPDVYEDVHRGLRAELTALDAAPAPAPRPYDNRS
ncbi:hypothetical protein [Streptomyces sp. NPDC004267]|uniref:hypothetical protein n=1 Tax=Streptomyces sp. NPDC004267 TaxID=3364694 RepID=UPI003693A41A